MPERDTVENKTENGTPRAGGKDVSAIIAEREILIFYVVLCFRFRPQIMHARVGCMRHVVENEHRRKVTS